MVFLFDAVKNSLIMKKFLIISILILLLTALSAFNSHNQSTSGMETVQEMVANNSVGYNLGCSFDGSEQMREESPGFWMDYEYGDNLPLATRELMQFLANGGITMVRIGVMWTEHVDFDTYEIRKDWMDRVQEVVDYVVDAGMYCLLCFWGDQGSQRDNLNWLCVDADKYPVTSFRYKTVWKQVAERFKDYGPLLLFDAFNEIVDSQTHFDNTSDENYETLNRLLHVVRATGGNNRYRNLALSVYSGQSNREHFFQKFKMPEDLTPNHLFISHHLYAEDFQIFDETVAANDIGLTIELLNKYFVQKGIPCVGGEFGGLLGMQPQPVSEPERAKYYGFLVREAAQFGIPCLAWDDVTDFTDRYYLKWTSQMCVDSMLVNAPKKGRANWNKAK